MVELFIENSVWALSGCAIQSLENIINRTLSDPTFEIKPKQLCIITSSAEKINTNVTTNPFDGCSQDTVIIIPLNGVMTKRSWFYNYGCDDLAQYINMANQSPKISGVVLLINSPGGEVAATFSLINAIKNATKPIYSLIDGLCCSAAMWVASYTDKIYATNKLCTIGSIGAMSTIVNSKKRDEKEGFQIHSIYPPESKYKNLAVREALDGNYQRFIDEILSPVAKEFQNNIKSNRKKIDLTVEGIIEGKDFYAMDAIKYNLIDGILNLSEIINQIKNESKTRVTIKSII